MKVDFADERTGRLARRVCERVRDAGGRAHYVGGMVRDSLLAIPVTEADIEVLGLETAQLEELLAGIGKVSLVGASFGVFKLGGNRLDVSVPRRERKVGEGHRGFEIDADPHLDPVQAAARRDFTINAIAWNPLTGEVIDPYGGRRDVEDRVLRHTSDRFDEDPLRVLRGMQFVGRFDLDPAPATVERCRSIGQEGLAAERVFEEWRKLIVHGHAIAKALDFLRATDWHLHHPELAALIDVQQDPEWHPEGDVWTHTGHVMDAFAAHRLGEEEEDLIVGLGALCHDFGKPDTTEFIEGRWRSRGHEEAGIAPTRAFLERMTNQQGLIDDVIPLVAEHLKPDQLFKAGAGASAVRRLAVRVERLDRLLRVAEADRRGRPPLEWDGFPARAWLEKMARDLDVVDHAPAPIVMGRHLVDLGLEPGPAFMPILDACFEAQLDGDITTLEEGITLARTLIE